MSRTVPEWIGRTDDAKVPPHVRARIFDAHGGVCGLTGRKIMTGELWDLDHRKPLADGGEHVESNLWPVLKAAHIAKTSAENGQRAIERRKRAKHIGLKPKPRNPMPGSKASAFERRLDGTTVRRSHTDS